jgi:hypothetical protein
MSHPTSQHYITLLVRGLLVLLCVLAVPRFASSESGAASDHPSPLSKFRAFSLDGSPARRIFSGLGIRNENCAVARVDIAFERGLMTYAVFLPDLPEGDSGQTWKSSSGGSDGTTILLGEKDCVVRIRIERATDLMVYDTRFDDRERTKQIREKIRQEREAQ